jgi:hypothetical protein
VVGTGASMGDDAKFVTGQTLVVEGGLAMPA